MMTHTRNLCSAFNPSKCTQTRTHTHAHTMFAHTVCTHKHTQTQSAHTHACTHTHTVCTHTHTHTHTHTVNTHPEQWAAILLRHPGSSWGFGALLKHLTSVMVLKVEESAGYSLQNQNGLIIEMV